MTDCLVCGVLKPVESWGDGIPWMSPPEPSKPPPPAFELLERQGSLDDDPRPYRCPKCGAEFDLNVRSSSFELSGNTWWNDYTLTRRRRSSG